MLVVRLLIGLPPAATPDEFSGVQLKKSARARPEWLEWQVGMGIQGGKRARLVHQLLEFPV